MELKDIVGDGDKRIVELNNWVVSLNNKNGDDKTILICKIEGR